MADGTRRSTKATPNTALKKIRESLGYSQAKLAEIAGCNQADITKLETGGKRTTVDWMIKLSGPLGVDPKELMPPAPGDTPLLILPGREVAIGPHRIRPRDEKDLIPVRSAARGGDQEMFLHDGPVDWIPRPPSLLNVVEPYAIYCVGESMLPRFRPGQLLYVNPHRPPTAGAGVVVTKRSNAVTIKEYVRKTNSTLFLCQYNPEDAIDIALDDVREMHVVVGLDEP